MKHSHPFLIYYFTSQLHYHYSFIIVILDVENFDFATEKYQLHLKDRKFSHILGICIVHLVAGTEGDC